MRTNIEIDDELMAEAMAATGTATKKAAVDAALRLTVRLKRQGEAIEGLWGLATWVGPDGDWFAPDPLYQGDGEPGLVETPSAAASEAVTLTVKEDCR